MIKSSTTLLTTLIATNVNVATVGLRIMEATDPHSNVMDFDYYKDTATEKFGPIRTANLVNDVRNEVKGSVLADNGDLIQGSPLTDYMSAKGLKAGDIHPVYRTLDALDYTVGMLGNHEFSYGPDYLKNALMGVKFPYVNTSVIDARTKQSMFTLYLIKDTGMVDKDEKKQTLKISYISVVPPQIMGWDKVNLFGKVTVDGITETVRKYVPGVHEEGVDAVAVLAHSGLSAGPYKVMAENSAYYLSETPGINVIVFGHAHVVFPGKNFADIEGADITKDVLNGVPAVMSGTWGDHLGMVGLQLSSDNSRWQAMQVKAEARPIHDIVNKKSLTAEDSKLVEALKADRDVARQFISKPIGKSVDNMYGYLVFVQDDLTVQVVNNTQKVYAEHYIQGDPDLAKLPVFSVAAPSRVGDRKNDPASYVEMEKGQLTSRNATDFYLYPNTPIVVKTSGKEMKEWLECSAGQFSQIDPSNTKPQSLINWDGSRTYNFDVIGGMNYQIDTTQPVRYDGEYQVINANAERIKNLTFNGKPVDPNAIFLVATNSHHACGGKFAGTGDSRIAFASLDENRSVLAARAADGSKRAGGIRSAADNNWRSAPIADDKKLGIHFETSPSDKAIASIKERGQYPMNKITTDGIEFAIYQVGLNK